VCPLCAGFKVGCLAYDPLPADQPAVLSDRAQLLDGCALECAVRLWLASRPSALFWCETDPESECNSTRIVQRTDSGQLIQSQSNWRAADAQQALSRKHFRVRAFRPVRMGFTSSATENHCDSSLHRYTVMFPPVISMKKKGDKSVQLHRVPQKRRGSCIAARRMSSPASVYDADIGQF
jgi:hypothetical protein